MKLPKGIAEALERLKGAGAPPFVMEMAQGLAEEVVIKRKNIDDKIDKYFSESESLKGELKEKYGEHMMSAIEHYISEEIMSDTRALVEKVSCFAACHPESVRLYTTLRVRSAMQYVIDQMEIAIRLARGEITSEEAEEEREAL